MKPVLTKDEFAITEQVATSFGAPGGVGEKLQHMLEEKGAKESNWVHCIILKSILQFSKDSLNMYYF